MDQITKNIMDIAVDFIKNGVYIFEITDPDGGNVLTVDGFLDTTYVLSANDYFGRSIDIVSAWQQTCKDKQVWKEFDETFCTRVLDEDLGYEQITLNPDAFKEPYEIKKAACVVDTNGNLLGDIITKSTYITTDEQGEIFYSGGL